MSSNLLHPETLNCKDLIELLKSRGLKVEPNNLDKYDLVELFYAYVLPLPQRKYRLNRQGKLLTQSQVKLNKASHVITKQKEQNSFLSRKRKIDDKESLVKHGLVNNPIVKDSAEVDVKKVVTKPPIDYERRTIRLSSSKTPSTQLTSPDSNSKPVTEKRPNTKVDSTEETPNKKARSKITWP